MALFPLIWAHPWDGSDFQISGHPQDLFPPPSSVFYLQSLNYIEFVDSATEANNLGMPYYATSLRSLLFSKCVYNDCCVTLFLLSFLKWEGSWPTPSASSFALPILFAATGTSYKGKSNGKQMQCHPVPPMLKWLFYVPLETNITFMVCHFSVVQRNPYFSHFPRQSILGWT